MGCAKYNQMVKIKLSLFGNRSGSILNFCKERNSFFILVQLCALRESNVYVNILIYMIIIITDKYNTVIYTAKI